ncbi:hypothetical protein C8R45DRAFT_992263, partial [Mycena sanguinolenta]
PTIIDIPGSFSPLAAYLLTISGFQAHGVMPPGIRGPVPHSYGGLVACEASKGLAKSVRKREGKAGGIVRIVFVTAVVP